MGSMLIDLHASQRFETIPCGSRLASFKSERFSIAIASWGRRKREQSFEPKVGRERKTISPWEEELSRCPIFLFLPTARRGMDINSLKIIQKSKLLRYCGIEQLLKTPSAIQRTGIHSERSAPHWLSGHVPSPDGLRSGKRTRRGLVAAVLRRHVTCYLQRVLDFFGERNVWTKLFVEHQ